MNVKIEATKLEVIPELNIVKLEITPTLTYGSGGGGGDVTKAYVDQQDALKVDKIAGKGLSTNDFTEILETKLNGIEAGAQVNAAGTVVDANYVHTENNYDDAAVLEVAKIANKVDKVTGKGLSTNDFTEILETKLNGIEAGAQVNAEGTVVDANYVHTDNNYDDSSVSEVAKIADKVDKVTGKSLIDDTEITRLATVTNYNDSGILAELDKKQTIFTGICQQQYLTENDVEIDTVNLKFKINTVRGGTTISESNPICFYTDGSGVATKHVINTPVEVSFTNTAAIWYISFNNLGQLVASTTPWTDFATIAAVYRFLWNTQLSGADRCVIHSVEFHKNDVSWIDHAWKHNEGTKHINGFDITASKTTGTPATDGTNTCIALTSGTCIDDNLLYTVTNNATPTLKFQQNLGTANSITNGGRFLATYNTATAFDLRKIAATAFPFVWNIANNKPQFIPTAGVATDVQANYFFVYYVYALQDPQIGEAVKIRSAEVEFANATLAAAHSWETLQAQSATLRDNEIRVLYKLTFEYKTNFSALIKYSALRGIDDLRKQKITSSTLVGTTLPATSVTETNFGNVQSAIEELDNEKVPTTRTINGLDLTANRTINASLIPYLNNQAFVNTTTDIIPDFSQDIWRTSNTQAVAETAVSNSTYLNLPTFTMFKTVRVYNAFTATRTLTLRTTDLVLGGITYSFQYINSNVIAIPTLKTLEISYEFIFTSSTTCTVSIISALQN